MEKTGDDASPGGALAGDGALDAGGGFFMGRLIKAHNVPEEQQNLIRHQLIGSAHATGGARPRCSR